MRHLFFLQVLWWFTIPMVAIAGGKHVVTGTYHVAGVCEQCKARIENAAYIKGVRFASWDAGTQLLTLRYDTDKVTPTLVLEQVANTGHDNEYMKAPDASYNSLPACCRYRSNSIKKHGARDR